MVVLDSLRKGVESLKATPTAEEEQEKIDRESCRARGGKWDAVNRTCIMPTVEPKPQEVKAPEAPQPNQDVQPLEGTEAKRSAQNEIDIINAQAGPLSAKEAQDQRLLEERRTAEGQALQGQVGQFDQTQITPTGLDTAEGITTGIVDAIPRALTLAGGAGLAGATAGAIGGSAVAPGPGTAVGATVVGSLAAAATFAGSLSSSIISSFKGQRRDTTTAQQRVLDEGKQTMNDWITMVSNDPANKGKYLAQYNTVSQQIDEARRQMILDTNDDVAKFETALPNLAEFEAFYAEGGERDNLDAEMSNALVGVSPPNYNFLELASRQGKL
jgi:hypothetical protein